MNRRKSISPTRRHAAIVLVCSGIMLGLLLLMVAQYHHTASCQKELAEVITDTDVVNYERQCNLRGNTDENI